MNKLRNRSSLYFVLFTTLLIMGIIIATNVGFTSLTLQNYLDLISGTASKGIYFTFVELRLPRVITVLFVGIGLAISGCILQGVSRNDLADPGVLGINTGAGLAVAVFIVFFSHTLASSGGAIVITAFIGAIISTLLIYLLSYIKGEGITPTRLILTGVAITAALNAATIMLLLRMKQDEYGFIEGWLSGNLWGANWTNIKFLIPGVIILGLLAFYKSRVLNILRLGDDIAKGLGVNIQKQMVLLLIIAVALSSLCVAVGGTIAFVGLLCPHLAKKLVGPKHQVLIPMSALVGAVLLVYSDIIARTVIAPNEVSIGIVVAIIGAPYFLYVLSK